jgi:type 1 glutamine amidotransferase
MKRHGLLLFTLSLLFLCASAFAADKKIVFVAGKAGHGKPGAHEYRAGCLLLQKCLASAPGIKTFVYEHGWPDDPKAFADADGIVLFSDGGKNNPLLDSNHLNEMDALMKKGVGLACLHFALEPTIEKGEKEFLEWIGGAFEINWSVNPQWEADFKKLPQHPITRGVKPFGIHDEWYFHMRFRDGMRGVTPILSAVAPAETTSRPDGSHWGNPAVREAVKNGEPQILAWSCERANGGRGFGFAGGHFHKNWGDENFRKLVLNGIVWISKAEIPESGVESKITADDLKKNLASIDGKGRKIKEK